MKYTMSGNIKKFNSFLSDIHNEDHIAHNEPSDYEKKVDLVVNQIIDDNLDVVEDATDIKSQELIGADVGVGDLEKLDDVNESHIIKKDWNTIIPIIQKIRMLSEDEPFDGDDMDYILNDNIDGVYGKVMKLYEANESLFSHSSIGKKIINVNNAVNKLSQMGELDVDIDNEEIDTELIDDESCPECDSDIVFDEDKAINSCDDEDCGWKGFDESIIIDVNSPEIKLIKECLGDSLPTDDKLQEFMESNLPNINPSDIKDVWYLIK